MASRSQSSQQSDDCADSSTSVPQPSTKSARRNLFESFKPTKGYEAPKIEHDEDGCVMMPTFKKRTRNFSPRRKVAPAVATRRSPSPARRLPPVALPCLPPPPPPELPPPPPVAKMTKWENPRERYHVAPKIVFDADGCPMLPVVKREKRKKLREHDALRATPRRRYYGLEKKRLFGPDEMKRRGVIAYKQSLERCYEEAYKDEDSEGLELMTERRDELRTSCRDLTEAERQRVQHAPDYWEEDISRRPAALHSIIMGKIHTLQQKIDQFPK